MDKDELNPIRTDDTNKVSTSNGTKKKLTEEEYRITQEKGTEAPFSGELLNNHDSGMYTCKVCDAPLFKSDAKFDSGTGWPSFDQALSPEAVKTITDTSHGMVRSEVVCGNCGAHLGHIFDDGPKETTGKRFCTNSASLCFKKKE